MGKVAVLKLGTGSFEEGFPVTLRLSEDAPLHLLLEVDGQLPPCPGVWDCYCQWQTGYNQIAKNLRLGAPTGQVVQVRYTEPAETYRLIALNLRKQLNQWLNSGYSGFQSVRDRLLIHLNPQEEIRFIIQTQDLNLWRIPWHLWDLIEAYPHAEIAVSSPQYEKPENIERPRKKYVKILAILGNAAGIDVSADRQVLQQLRHAKVTFLAEPQRSQLHLLRDESWDILFFAGHSQKGKLKINQQDEITIDELKSTLVRAVSNGLQLAIFNSCDGLELARDIADLKIPQTIVMREPVPDQLAQEFLKYLLNFYSHGHSLYSSVRESRERLREFHDLEAYIPGVSWLPIIYQNPSTVPVSWQQLHERLAEPSYKHSIKNKWKWLIYLPPIFLTSLIAYSLIRSIYDENSNENYHEFMKLAYDGMKKAKSENNYHYYHNTFINFRKALELRPLDPYAWYGLLDTGFDLFQKTPEKGSPVYPPSSPLPKSTPSPANRSFANKEIPKVFPVKHPISPQELKPRSLSSTKASSNTKLSSGHLEKYLETVSLQDSLVQW
uniref:CHAT domain-containing protein n=1 Tax=Cyanothece sp. (strain PCC 7425 / ATCC 29141) TaxID=395961 RepID=B8HYT2_CYAP4